MRKRRSLIVVLGGSLLLAGGAAGQTADETPAAPTTQRAELAPAVPPGVILDTTSFWRIRTVMETPELTLADGKVGHVKFTWGRGAYAWFKDNPGQAQLPTTQYAVEEEPLVRLPAETSAEWMKPAFDDSDWARLRAPVLKDSIVHDWKLILMRGLFEVTDPAALSRAGGLNLSLSFRGGAVVYLNGEELTRAFMPTGEIDPYSSAEPYPDDAHFDAEGYAGNRKDKTFIERRTRRLTEFKIPAGKVRHGVNVLAIAVHRSATSYKTAIRRIRAYPVPAYTRTEEVTWAEIGLLDVRLAGEPGAAVVPNVSLLKGRGFKVWNQSINQKVFVPDYPDPFSPLEPIHLIGVRAGTFAGQVIVGDDRPINGLKVEVADLKGPATIAASAVQVRYGLPDGPVGYGQTSPPWFDSLNDEPPAEVPVFPEHGGAVQPLWVTVTVPPDAKPGDYTGTATISAEGVKPVAAPLKLRVIDWSLPPVDKYVTTMDVIQSPESVALAYNVPLWSEEHFKLLDRTFALLGRLGAKTLYVTCIRRTHFGNEHAMVRWIRGEDEELTPDFRIAEKYLDVATRHMGTPRGVILYCWEPPESQGHAGQRPWDKPVLITVVDPKTGKMSPIEGPAIGTPESKVFWRKLTDGIQSVLKKRGLENAMLLGLIGDSRPTKVAMDDMASGLDGKDRWALHSHLFCDKWQGHDVAFVNALWGIGVEPRDPSQGYAFGWSNPLWLSYYPREMHISSTLVEHRVKLETWMGARKGYTPFIAPGTGARGLGRLGGDFWTVVKNRQGRLRYTLAGRYPEAAWGQLDLNFCVSYLLGKGPKGALATVRSEALRLGLQEVEARIYVEKAWLDPEAKTLLGDEMMTRIRDALDERIRVCLGSSRGTDGESWFIASDWNSRTEKLFGLAAEIAKKLGREPNPYLAPRPGLDKPPADKKK